VSREKEREREREREAGSHLGASEHIMLNAAIPDEEALVIWQGCETHSAACRRDSNFQTDSWQQQAWFYFSIEAQAPYLHATHCLIRGQRVFPSCPPVRNNLQHCWAACHLTLHGQNTQPALEA